MRCPTCDAPLRVVRTVRSSPQQKAVEWACEQCHASWVGATTVLRSQSEYGTGAHALASKLRSGELRIELSGGDGGAA